jgi:hypothetical protein
MLIINNKSFSVALFLITLIINIVNVQAACGGGLCNTYSDCSFCGLYERCCWRPGGPGQTCGSCQCGTSGKDFCY